MKTAEPDRSEVHIPQPVVHFFTATCGLGQRMTDVPPARVPADPAVAACQPALVMPGVDQRLEPRAVRTRRRCIAALRRRVAERFVWPLGVVALAEAIEAALLRREMRVRRARRRGIEGFVHPLVTTILLLVCGIDQ